jgi:hypothetical protein
LQLAGGKIEHPPRFGYATSEAGWLYLAHNVAREPDAACLTATRRRRQVTENQDLPKTGIFPRWQNIQKFVIFG